MKHVLVILSYFVAFSLFIRCGGVIGNIEKYPFSGISEDSLKVALNRVYITYPMLEKKDTTMYGENDSEKFLFILINEDKKIVFTCHVVTYTTYDIELSLTTATTWGEIMRLAPNMGFFEKRKYRKLFERHILPKIKSEVDRYQQKTID